MRATTVHIKKRRSGYWLLLLIIPLILGGGALGVLWYWNTHKKGIIRQKLESAVLEKSDGLYRIRYDSMEMNEAAGNISFYHMHLGYDSVRYLQLTKDDAPPVLFN